MVEIIKRASNTNSQAINNTKFQISYNNFGHLVFRWFTEGEKTDTLIVLTAEETRNVLYFLRSLRNLSGGDC